RPGQPEGAGLVLVGNERVLAALRTGNGTTGQLRGDAELRAALRAREPEELDRRRRRRRGRRWRRCRRQLLDDLEGRNRRLVLAPRTGDRPPAQRRIDAQFRLTPRARETDAVHE